MFHANFYDCALLKPKCYSTDFVNAKEAEEVQGSHKTVAKLHRPFRKKKNAKHARELKK